MAACVFFSSWLLLERVDSLLTLLCLTLMDSCEMAMIELLGPASRDNLDMIAVVKYARSSVDFRESLSKALGRRRAAPVLSTDVVASLLTAHNFLGMSISNPPDAIKDIRDTQDLWWAFQWQDEIEAATDDREKRLNAYITFLRFGMKAASDILEYSRRSWELTRQVSDNTCHPCSFLAIIESLVTTGVYGFAQGVFPILPRSYVSSYMPGREKIFSAMLQVS